MKEFKSNQEQLKAFLANRQRAYHEVFSSESAPVKEVMRDLRRFCRVDESCFHPDPRTTALLEGRREVFLRIQEHLNLNLTQLINLHTRKDL